MVYNRPQFPWKRYGLKVLGTPGTDARFAKDGNMDEWAVAYFALRDPTGYETVKTVLEGAKIRPI